MPFLSSSVLNCLPVRPPCYCAGCLPSGLRDCPRPVFGVARVRLLENAVFFMAGVERDVRSAGRYINHRLLPTKGERRFITHHTTCQIQNRPALRRTPPRPRVHRARSFQVHSATAEGPASHAGSVPQVLPQKAPLPPRRSTTNPPRCPSSPLRLSSRIRSRRPPLLRLPPKLRQSAPRRRHQNRFRLP